MGTTLSVLIGIAGIAQLLLTLILERQRIREAISRLWWRSEPEPVSGYAAFGGVIVDLHKGEVVGFVGDP